MCQNDVSHLEKKPTVITIRYSNIRRKWTVNRIEISMYVYAPIHSKS